MDLVLPFDNITNVRQVSIANGIVAQFGQKVTNRGHGPLVADNVDRKENEQNDKVRRCDLPPGTTVGHDNVSWRNIVLGIVVVVGFLLIGQL
jgi:hypothetical protein